MQSHSSPGRGIAVILVVGAALGIAYNEAGHLSRPERGIPWVAPKLELPELESQAPADTIPANPEASHAAPADPALAARSDSPPMSHAQPKSRTPKVPGTPAGKAPGAPDGSGHANAAPDSAPAREPAPVPETRRASPLPFLPESDRPIQIKLATAKTLFDARAALFLDARDATEFEAGHIPGAIRLTRDDAVSDPARVKALLPQGKPLVTYCEGGACEASLDLARALVDAGYRRVLVYAGGFPEWAAAGHPVERGRAGP